jgi:hypothetical protein
MDAEIFGEVLPAAVDFLYQFERGAEDLLDD